MKNLIELGLNIVSLFVKKCPLTAGVAVLGVNEVLFFFFLRDFNFKKTLFEKLNSSIELGLNIMSFPVIKSPLTAGVAVLFINEEGLFSRDINIIIFF